MIYQRGSSTGVTATGHYGADRQKYLVQYGTYTITQQADAPTNEGFAFSADIDCTTAGSPTAGQSLINRISPLEGYDSKRFAYGTSGAKTSTVSFWIKCSYADSFTLAMVDHDNQRSCFRSFTINQADTWEYKTLTFPGDTSGNGADNDNSLGLSLDLIIGGGTDWRGSSAPERVWNTRSNNQDSYLTKNVTSFGTSTSHTMNITGVQWEFGHNATEFEHRSYGEELALCQRYYEVIWQNNNSSSPHSGGDGYNTIATGAYTGSHGYYVWNYRTQKRVRPTINYSGKLRVLGGASVSNLSPNEFYSPGVDAARIRVPHSGSNGQAFVLEFDGGNSSNGYISASAEL